MDYKRVRTPETTITRDVEQMSREVGNVYETVVIIAKRSNQINGEMKEEIKNKLQDFSYYGDSIEEVFENREQIEISKFYEKIPKSTLIATQEFLNNKLYYKNPIMDSLDEA